MSRSGAQAWGWDSDSVTWELAESLPLHLGFLIWETDLLVAPLQDCLENYLAPAWHGVSAQ